MSESEPDIHRQDRSPETSGISSSYQRIPIPLIVSLRDFEASRDAIEDSFRKLKRKRASARQYANPSPRNASASRPQRFINLRNLKPKPAEMKRDQVESRTSADYPGRERTTDQSLQVGIRDVLKRMLLLVLRNMPVR
jgi:hypothetical protein